MKRTDSERGGRGAYKGNKGEERRIRERCTREKMSASIETKWEVIVA